MSIADLDVMMSTEIFCVCWLWTYARLYGEYWFTELSPFLNSLIVGWLMPDWRKYGYLLMYEDNAKYMLK